MRKEASLGAIGEPVTSVCNKNSDFVPTRNGCGPNLYQSLVSSVLLTVPCEEFLSLYSSSKQMSKVVMMMHTWNLSTLEAEAGAFQV